MQIALQATVLGYSAHAMAGLEFGKASRVLDIPDRFRLEVGITIGRRANPARLPDYLQVREVPSDRMPLEQISFPGTFPSRFNAITAE